MTHALHTVHQRLLTALFLLFASLSVGCGEGTFEQEGEEFEVEEVVSELSSSQRRARLTLIRDAARGAGLTNAVLLAGIANAETNLAHCWSEATWACQGPASSSCGGGPVIAGAGDGPCHLRQGGLGLFQFDGGTHDQTLARDGRGILTVEGNTSRAVDFVVDMVIRSQYIANVSNRQQALAWMNTVRIDSTNWDAWIKTVTHYYNGCVPGRCSVYTSRYNMYARNTRTVYNELGQSFWYGSSGASTTPPPATTTPPASAPTTSGLSQPSGLSPSAASVERNGSVQMRWGAVSGATAYEVNMDVSSNGQQWATYYTWRRTTNSHQVWPQTWNRNYRWRVRACNGSGCGAWSGYVNFVYGSPTQTASAPTPQPPQGLSAPGNLTPGSGTFSTESVVLRWGSVSGAARYDIDMQYKRSGSWTAYYTWRDRTATTFTVWPQVNRTDYRWRVRACDASRCSDWSGYKQFTYSR